MAMGSDMLATPDVAKLLGVSTSRVRQFVMDGSLKPDGRIGVNLLFQRRQVAALRRKRLTDKPRKKTSQRP